MSLMQNHLASPPAGPDSGLAHALTQSFLIANTTGKARGVASGLANAVGVMSGTTMAEIMTDIIHSLNDVADNADCGLAGSIAADFYVSLKQNNPANGVAFMAAAAKDANQCWPRRLAKIAGSAILSGTLATNPCTKRMQQASAVSVSLVTASACSTKPFDAQAAGYALVTAAMKDGCSFSSAVTAAIVQGRLVVNLSVNDRHVSRHLPCCGSC